MELYPLLFEPNRHDKIWGGEDWLISGHHSSPSVVANGPLRGQTLECVASEHGRALMGTDTPQSDRFPLLFKVIDARDRLSVQVHPGESTAAAVGGEAKTEMWYALDHAASIYAGFRSGMSKEDVEAALRAGGIEDALAAMELPKGSCLFIPGGLVHAICAGSLLYEVQQSSDTTYRLHDWGRVGTDGRPREMHLEKALAVIDCTLPPPMPRADVECRHFRFMRRLLDGPLSVPGDGRTFRALHAEDGAVRIAWRGGEALLAQGRSAVIPANRSVELKPEAPTHLLVTELGRGLS